MPANNETDFETEHMASHFEAAGIVDEALSGEESLSGTSSESGTASTAGTDETSEIKGAPGKDSLSNNADGTPKSGKEEKGKVTNNPGDLTLADGSVVKAGAERRHYETAQIAKQRVQLLSNDLNTANQKLQNAETRVSELTTTLQQFGNIEPAAAKAAVTMYGDLQRDPVGTVQKLLVELKAKGHNIEGIGEGIDTRAIHTLLDERLKPSPQQTEQERQQQIDQEVDREVTEFVQQFPDALTHEQHIAALVTRVQEERGIALPLRDAYFMLKERVVNDGLDWAQPLGPQIQARKAATVTPPVVAPRVNGRVGADGSSQEIDPTKVITPENETSDAIVRASMREAGYSV